MPRYKHKQDYLGTTRITVYDNEGKSFDRYTIIFDDEPENLPGMYMALGLSSNPQSPQGFSQFTQAMKGKHLGKRVQFDELPKNVRDHVFARFSDSF